MPPILVCLNGALRLTDNVAISEAIQAVDDGLSDSIVLAHVANMEELSDVRLVSLQAALSDLRERVGGKVVSLVHKSTSAKSSDAGLFDPLVDLAADIGAQKVIMQQAFEPHAAAAQQNLARQFARLADSADDTEHTSPELQLVPGAYAVEPGTVLSGAKTPYKVFTPYSKTWRGLATRSEVSSNVSALDMLADTVGSFDYTHDPLADPAAEAASRLPETARRVATSISETKAWKRWEHFAADELKEYETGRDRPAIDGTSRMSAYLAFGMISPRSLLDDIATRIEAGTLTAEEADKFISELAWREFYADQLFHRPEVAEHNADKRFDHYRWHESDSDFDAWCEGQTGFPIVDAGMRQLAETGWMHNRVRMIVASFLIKDLHLRWQEGAAHFRNHLVDYNPASNQLSWQWCAGSGFDASPFFRVFNPMRQGRKFDPQGEYVRRWVPELADLVTEIGGAVHDLPENPERRPSRYPAPLVEHGEERREALRRFEQVKGLDRE